MDRDDTRFDQSRELISGLRNYDDLPEALYSLRDLYGVANLGYHALQVEGLSHSRLPIIATFDQAWVRRYIEREFVEIDPVARSARQTDLPIDWRQIDRSSTDAKRYFFEMSRFDVRRQGMGIPIHGPQGNAIFTFTSQIADETEWRSFRRRNKPELYLLARYIHNKIIALVKGVAEKPVLSRQERNCLELSAQGHNALAIAAILGLSVHTARMHLSRAQKRLNAHSRTEAVAKALAQGLIRNRRQAIIMTFTPAAFKVASIFEIPVLFS